MTFEQLLAFPSAYERYVDFLDDIRFADAESDSTQLKDELKKAKLMDSASTHFAIVQTGSTDPAIYGKWKYDFINMLTDNANERRHG